MAETGIPAYKGYEVPMTGTRKENIDGADRYHRAHMDPKQYLVLCLL